MIYLFTIVIVHRFLYVYQVGYGMIPQPPEAKHLFQVGLKVQHRLNAQDPGAGSCLFWLRKTTGDFAARILRFNASQLLFLGASIIDVYCYTI